jgi:hypothetical protein
MSPRLWSPLFGRTSPRTKSTQTPKRQPVRRLTVELLEERNLPSGLYQLSGPALAPAGPAAASEGYAFHLNLDTDEAVTNWTIDWGDGQVENLPGDPTGVDHIYQDDGSYLIGATATDGTGNHIATLPVTGATQLVINVNNVPPKLIIGSTADLVVGSPFILNLSASDPGDDTITSWTIDWGDGTVQSVDGNPSSVSHPYAEGRLFYEIWATAKDEDTPMNGSGYVALSPQSDLLVFNPTVGAGNLVRLDGVTGVFRGPFTSDDILVTGRSAVGPDGTIYVPDNFFDSRIHRYDGRTGTDLGDWTLPADFPFFGYISSLAFGRDGNLYAAFAGEFSTTAEQPASLLRLDGRTGVLLGWSGPSMPGLGDQRPSLDIAVGADGDIYLADRASLSNRVLRFDGATGKQLSDFATNLPFRPGSVLATPDGKLLVSNIRNNQLFQFDLNDPVAPAVELVDAPDSVPNRISRFSLSPDGSILYLTQPNSPDVVPVRRYDATTGAPLSPDSFDNYVAGSAEITFRPGMSVRSTVIAPTDNRLDIVASAAGDIQTAGQADFYSFKQVMVPGMRIWEFRVIASGASMPDPKLTLYDPAGNILAVSDDESPGLLNAELTQSFNFPEGIFASSPWKPVYFLGVSASDDSAALGAYQFTATAKSAAPPLPDAFPHSKDSRSVTSDFNRDGVNDDDFNRDGLLDLTVTNDAGDGVVVFLGQGNGTFQESQEFQAGQGIGQVVAADFNNDGRTDLATVNRDDKDGTVSILLGFGDGRFQDQKKYSIGIAGTTLVSGYFDNDNILDLVAADPNSAFFAFLRGRGDGTFFDVANAAGTTGITVLNTGDYDGDGKKDLLGGGAGIFPFFGDGAGRFTAKPTIYQVSGFPINQVLQLITGDFSTLKDGKSDFLVNYGQIFEVFADDSPGGFDTDNSDDGSPKTLGASGFAAVGDFDGDGSPDVIGGNGGGIQGGVLALTMNARNVVNSYLGGQLANNDLATILTGDFNNDGRTDITFSNRVALSAGNNRFIETPDIASDAGSPPLVHDFDGTNGNDVVTVDAQGNILARLATNVPGVFKPAVPVNPGRPAQNIALVQSGTQFFVAATDRTPDAQGQFHVSLYRLVLVDDAWHWQQDGELPTGELPGPIAVGDLNGDSRDDLVVRNIGSGTLSIFLANSGGGFEAPQSLPISEDFGNIDLADVNSDQFLDIVMAEHIAGTVNVLLNRGDGSFAQSGRWHSSNGIYFQGLRPGTASRSDAGFSSFVTGDLNGDGQLDVVALNGGLNSFSVLFGKGFGNLVNPEDYSLPARPMSAVIADVNGDNRPDVIVGLANRTLAVYLGEEDPAEPPRSRLPDKATFFTSDLGTIPTGLTAADADGDGILDLFVANSFGDSLLLMGQGKGEFQPFHVSGQSIPLAWIPTGG